jgi:dsRNA-specific ribonuclease
LISVVTNDVDNSISRVETITGYTFKNKLLCAEALQMKEPNCSLRIADVIHSVNKNRDLELVGDAVVNPVLVKMWYEASNHNGTFSLHHLM